MVVHSDCNSVGLYLAPIGQVHAMAVISRQPLEAASGVVSELWIMYTKVFPAEVDYRTVESHVGNYCGEYNFQLAKMKMVVPEVSYCGKETVQAIRKRRLGMAVYPVLLSTGKTSGTADDIVTLPWAIVLNLTARVLTEKRIKVGRSSIEDAEKLEDELKRVSYSLTNPTKPIDVDRIEESPPRDPLVIATMLAVWGIEEHGPKGFHTGPRSHIAPKYNPLSRDRR